MRNWVLLYSSDDVLAPDAAHRVRSGGEFIAPGLYAVQESLGGVPAPVARHGPYALMGDVRLDNREDVRRALSSPSSASDEELVLRGFERWDEACVDRFVGVWAFGIWDAERHRLWLARDPIGIRQLYYAERGSVFACASEIEALFPLWAVGRPSVNVEWVRGMACWNYERMIDETAWQGIRSLPGGHAWQAVRGTQRPYRYWFFGGVEMPADLSDEDHAEHLRSLLQESVRCRLDHEGPTALAVSGGLDSTALLSAAHAVVTRGHVAQLRLYNLTDSHEEGQLLDAIERWYGYPVAKLDRDAALCFHDIGCIHGQPMSQPTVDLVTSSVAHLLQLAAADGCRSLLHGEGGNTTLGDRVYRGGRFLRDWSVRQWAVESRAAMMKTGVPLWRLVGQALAPDILRARFRRPRPELPIKPAARISWAGRRALQTLLGGQACYVFSQEVEVAARCGFEFRYPFLDVRLINYMVSLPAPYHGRRGVSRWLMREATAGIMPESIRTSTRIYTPAELIAARVLGPDSAVIEDLLRTPMLEQFVDVDDILSIWRSLGSLERSTQVFFEHVNPAAAIAAWIRRHGLSVRLPMPCPVAA